jgi:glucosamine-phosphate N-acetyltransferase
MDTINISYTTLLCIVNSESSYTIIEDIKNQYVNLISQLSVTGNIPSNLDFITRVNEISKTSVIVIAYYLTDTPNEYGNSAIIVGTGTVLFENKLSHDLGCVAHVEDVVVHNEFRSRGIATAILSHAERLARENKCYKIILDCKRDVCKVYEKSGYNTSGIQMTLQL